MGCFHTLQPEKDPYAPPAIPALTPQGYVRWQTVQLLLEPEEHVPFLQEAVKRFELVNPADGLLFPTLLPKEALPSKPDLKMTEWHDTVSEKLMLEAQASGLRVPSIGAHAANLESSRDSSFDSQSLVDARDHVLKSYPRPLFHTPNFIPIPPCAPPTRSPRQWSTQEPPWSPENRRSSHRTNHHPSSRSRDGATPTASSHHRHPPRPHSRPRSPSTLSTTSSSSSSSSGPTASSASSPRLHHRHHSSSHLHPLPAQITERRHSTPNSPSHRPLQHQNTSNSYFPSQHPRPPRGNARGLNVRWRDVDTVFELPRSVPGTPEERGMSLVERRREGDVEAERGRGGMRSPLRGVGGRRYATEGMNWR